MKKIATLAVLPVIALASCEKEEVQINTPIESQNEVVNETTSTSTLNENITQTSTDEQAFNFNYEIGGNQVPVSGKFVLEKGIVTEMIVNGATINGETPIDKFATNAPSQVIGKSLNWLKIDSVSGASYVTMGFNEFLTTLQ